MMKIEVALIIFMFLLLQETQSQDYEFDHIDKYVDNLTIQKHESFETIAKKIVKSDWETIEKYRALFYWIAKNIQYDYDGLKTDFWKQYPSNYKIAQDTYILRKGVCSGYSHLFRLMCEEVCLEAKVISGYARIENYQAGIAIKESNHAWNAIKLVNKWELIDVTWANSSAKNQSINDYYFLTPPEQFIVNHFPKNEEWQLLKTPITKKEFDSYPYISSDFFDLDFNKGFPKKGLIKNNDGHFEIVLYPPEDISLLAKIYDYNNSEWLTSVYSTKKSDDKIIITINIDNKGKYLLEVSSLFQNESYFKIHKGLLYYTLIYE